MLTPLIERDLITIHEKVDRVTLSRYLIKHITENHQAALAFAVDAEHSQLAHEAAVASPHSESEVEPAEEPVKEISVAPKEVHEKEATMQSDNKQEKKPDEGQPKSKAAQEAEDILRRPAIEVSENSPMAESVSIEDEIAAGNTKPARKKRKSLVGRIEIPKGYKAPPPADNDPDPLPIYGVAAGSAANSISISQEEMDRTARPQVLKDEKGAYALFVDGNSMVPLFNAGDTVYVCPEREYTEGDFVIIKTQLYATAPVMSYIKQFTGRTDDGVALRQLNPPAGMEFKNTIITEIHRVMLPEELQQQP